MRFAFKKQIDQVLKENIRFTYHKPDDTWYFSIVDVIALITHTKDARNYWKVLKNRLNKANNELVTFCNQLKLPSKDGKKYLTDTFTAENIILFIEMIDPKSVNKFKEFFEEIEGRKLLLYPSSHPHTFSENDEEAELRLDIWQNQKFLFVRFMIGGLDIEDIKICFEGDNLNITGKREIKTEDLFGRDYFKQELFWGNFSRTIALPTKINSSEFEARIYKGMVTLKFQKA